jgi:nicotinamide mononucleotide (NMN) deamidase PncC
MRAARGWHVATAESCTGGLARCGSAPRTEYRVFPGDRAAVRGAALELALGLLAAEANG